MEGELAYLAGFFDGEGSICIAKGVGTSYYLLSVSVTNTCRDVLDMYRDIFGGSVIKTKRDPHHKDAFVWKVEARKAESFLLVMRGRLVVKHEQLELALRFRDLFRGRYLLPRGNTDRALPQHDEKRSNVIALRESAYFRMQELNRRGVELDGSACGL